MALAKGCLSSCVYKRCILSHAPAGESHLNHRCVQEFFPTLAAIERGVRLTLEKHGNRIKLLRSTAQANEEVSITCS